MPVWVCCIMVSNLYNHALISLYVQYTCACVREREFMCAHVFDWYRKRVIHSWLTHLTPTEAHFSQQQASQTPTNTFFLSVTHTRLIKLDFAVTSGMFKSPIKDLALPVGLCVICSQHSEALVTIKVRWACFVNAGCWKPAGYLKWLYGRKIANLNPSVVCEDFAFGK